MRRTSPIYEHFKKRPAPDSDAAIGAIGAKRARKEQSNTVRDSHEIRAAIQTLVADGWKFPARGRFSVSRDVVTPKALREKFPKLTSDLHDKTLQRIIADVKASS